LLACRLQKRILTLDAYPWKRRNKNKNKNKKNSKISPLDLSEESQRKKGRKAGKARKKVKIMKMKIRDKLKPDRMDRRWAMLMIVILVINNIICWSLLYPRVEDKLKKTHAAEVAEVAEEAEVEAVAEEEGIGDLEEITEETEETSETSELVSGEEEEVVEDEAASFFEPEMASEEEDVVGVGDSYGYDNRYEDLKYGDHCTAILDTNNKYDYTPGEIVTLLYTPEYGSKYGMYDEKTDAFYCVMGVKEGKHFRLGVRMDGTTYPYTALVKIPGVRKIEADTEYDAIFIKDLFWECGHSTEPYVTSV